MNDSERARLRGELEMLRFLRRVQIQQLEQTERWIGRAEHRLARSRPDGPLPPRPRRPTSSNPPARWILEQSIAGPVTVHTGDCWIPVENSQPLTRAQARSALADGAMACPGCRADRTLEQLG
ncbi:DUF6233 domain-containing protein [Streptomyces sp. NBC_00690]|uniref:DUF6233 domain-containing protein n=1 Tax=Streptomyces sp. NBC_00690 TaxID=2975808 RepID=UPI002E2BDD5A|nr:DUF6233 domain-containing protein [Streptomyces sp. NBC_00690]